MCDVQVYFVRLLRHDYRGSRLIVQCGFFLQAEDGIRDLVRSRGLGDVYKRQGAACRGRCRRRRRHRRRGSW